MKSACLRPGKSKGDGAGPSSGTGKKKEKENGKSDHFKKMSLLFQGDHQCGGGYFSPQP
jgi:hypothetical protein